MADGVSWREAGLARAKELESLAAWLRSQTGGESAEGAEVLYAAVQSHLEAAYAAIRHRSWIRRSSRADSLRAASNLDAAEAHILQLAPTAYVRGQLPELLTYVQRKLPIGDPRRVEVEQLVRRSNDRGLTAADRSALVSGLRAAQSAELRKQVRLQSFRNILAVTTALVTLVAISLAVVGALAPNALTVCFPLDASLICPTGVIPASGVRKANPADLALVEMVGLAAAAIAAAAAVRSVSAISGLPVLLAVLKLPTGALTSVLGLLLLRGDFLPGTFRLDTPAQILAWALVFGYAQQLLTRPVDAQAQRLFGRGVDRAEATGTPRNVDQPALESAITAALHGSVASARPVNYTGVLSVRLEDDEGQYVAPDMHGRFPVRREQQYQIFATVGPESAASTRQVPVLIQDGDPAEIVPFTIGLVGGQSASYSREESVELRGSEGTATVRFPFTPGTGADATVWVRLAQRGSLVQIVEIEFELTTTSAELA